MLVEAAAGEYAIGCAGCAGAGRNGGEAGRVYRSGEPMA